MFHVEHLRHEKKISRNKSPSWQVRGYREGKEPILTAETERTLYSYLVIKSNARGSDHIVKIYNL
jgi:hypothetical protein